MRIQQQPVDDDHDAVDLSCHDAAVTVADGHHSRNIVAARGTTIQMAMEQPFPYIAVGCVAAVGAVLILFQTSRTHSLGDV